MAECRRRTLTNDKYEKNYCETASVLPLHRDSNESNKQIERLKSNVYIALWKKDNGERNKTAEEWSNALSSRKQKIREWC